MVVDEYTQLNDDECAEFLEREREENIKEKERERLRNAKIRSFNWSVGMG